MRLLSAGGKFVNWMRSTYGVRNFVSAALIAGIPNVSDEPVFPAEPQINSLDEEFAYDQQLTEYGAAEQSWRDNTEQDIRYHGRRFIGGLSESELGSRKDDLPEHGWRFTPQPYRGILSASHVLNSRNTTSF